MLSANVMSAQSLFWVGNSGNWNDPSNWSNVSGGMGNAGAPDPNTNVVFDTNSFISKSNIVTVNGDASCASIDATFSSFGQMSVEEDVSLTVNGDFQLSNKLGLTMLGELVVHSSSIAHVDFGNQGLSGSVVFEGSGIVHLDDDVLVNRGSIHINCESFVSNGHNIVADEMYSQAGNSWDLAGSKTVIHNKIDLIEAVSYTHLTLPTIYSV